MIFPTRRKTGAQPEAAGDAPAASVPVETKVAAPAPAMITTSV